MASSLLNTQTSNVSPGKLLLFRYSAKYKDTLPFYDKHPLCYVLATESGAFYGINLHYTKPSNRMAIMRYLDEDNDPTVITGYHKYLYGYVRSNFSEVPMSDWEKAFSLSLSEFVRVLGGIEMPVNIARYQ